MAHLGDVLGKRVDELNDGREVELLVSVSAGLERHADGAGLLVPGGYEEEPSTRSNSRGRVNVEVPETQARGGLETP